MITRALAGLVLATHLAVGLLTAGTSLSSGAEIHRDAPSREDGTLDQAREVELQALQDRREIVA